VNKIDREIIDNLIDYYGTKFQNVHQSKVPGSCCRKLAMEFVKDLRNLKGENKF
jgi:hypothetical protein